jgi:DNA-binding phage protein
MGVSSTNYYYHPIPGSKVLITHPSGAQKELQAIEKAAENETIEVVFNGEKLHKFPTSGIIDKEDIEKTLNNLKPLQQLVFLHLFLLSTANGADWCRVGMTELARRTGMSRRRLLRTLSELARVERIKPLDRDRNGTLYKVYSIYQKQLPEKPVLQKMQEPQEKQDAIKKPKQKEVQPKQRKKPIESPVNEEFFPKKQNVLTIKDIAKSYFEKAGIAPDDVRMDEAIGQITYLLEDGFSRDEVAIGVKYIAHQFGKKASIDKLPYYIHQAIEAERGN